MPLYFSLPLPGPFRYGVRLGGRRRRRARSGGGLAAMFQLFLYCVAAALVVAAAAVLAAVWLFLGVAWLLCPVLSRPMAKRWDVTVGEAVTRMRGRITALFGIQRRSAD